MLTEEIITAETIVSNYNMKLVCNYNMKFINDKKYAKKHAVISLLLLDKL